MRKAKKVFCNKCGQSFCVKKDIIQEGIFEVEYEWGYFSEKDGEIHSFDLCESCYDELVNSFVLPVTKEENQELL